MTEPTPPKVTNAKGSTTLVISSENGNETHAINMLPNQKLVLYVAEIAEIESPT